MSHLARMTAAILATVVLGVGCAHTQGPVLYPNAKLKEAGQAQAEAEISACRSLADDLTSSGAPAKAMTGTAESVGPSPVYKGFVDRCLRERGYEVTGWQ